MRKPEEIEQEIEALKKELEEANRYKLVWGRNNQNINKIGIFNIGKGRLLLGLLNIGSKLQLRYGDYNPVNVGMDTLRNRLIVETDNIINEENILYYIFGEGGDWYLDTKYQEYGYQPIHINEIENSK